MASGSSVTIDGGTNMTQTVTGDIIDDADFNNARTNVDTLMGTAADITLSAGSSMAAVNTIFGYNQGGAGVSAASAGTLVGADTAAGGFKRLQDDVQSLCAFLGQSLRTDVGSDVADGDTIDATMVANLMLNVKDCWDNRFSPASRTSATEASVTYTSQWSSQLTQETTFTFGSESLCRAYFNAGGRLGFLASRSGGSSTTQNTNWTDLLSAMGDIGFDYQGGFGSSGSSSGIGFYELATSYQDIWTKFGSGAYASNFFKLQAKVNSTTNPTVVTLKMIASDPHAEGSGVGPDGVPGTGDDGFGNDFIDGTFTLNARTHTPDASGSGFSITKPTDSLGSISGS